MNNLIIDTALWLSSLCLCSYEYINKMWIRVENKQRATLELQITNIQKRQIETTQVAVQNISEQEKHEQMTVYRYNENKDKR